MKTNLVARNGVEERRYAFVKEVEERGEVDDNRAAKGLGVVPLENIQHLRAFNSGRDSAQERERTFRATAIDGFVRSVVDL